VREKGGKLCFEKKETCKGAEKLVNAALKRGLYVRSTASTLKKTSPVVSQKVKEQEEKEENLKKAEKRENAPPEENQKIFSLKKRGSRMGGRAADTPEAKSNRQTEVPKTSQKRGQKQRVDQSLKQRIPARGREQIQIAFRKGKEQRNCIYNWKEKTSQS